MAWTCPECGRALTDEEEEALRQLFALDALVNDDADDPEARLLRMAILTSITDLNMRLMWEKKSQDGSAHDVAKFFPWSFFAGLATIWDWVDGLNATNSPDTTTGASRM